MAASPRATTGASRRVRPGARPRRCLGSLWRLQRLSAEVLARKCLSRRMGNDLRKEPRVVADRRANRLSHQDPRRPGADEDQFTPPAPAHGEDGPARGEGEIRPALLPRRQHRLLAHAAVRHRIADKQAAGQRTDGKPLLDCPSYLYQALVTNLPTNVPPLEVWRQYNPRAGCEEVIK